MRSPLDFASKTESPPFRIGRLLLCVFLSGAVACSSQIGEVPEGRGRPGSGASAGSGGAGSGGGGTGGGGTSTPPAAVDPGTKEVHRLNSNEYNATVADVLGTKLAPANSSWLGGEIGGFDNVASVLDVDATQYKRYFDAASAIAEDVFATAALKAKVVTCAPADDATCVSS